MGLTEIVKRACMAGALATASVGAGALTVSVPAVAEAKPLEELTPSTFAKNVYHNPLPVVVLFYEAETDLGNDGSLAYSRRMEQVVEALADKYDGQVAFFRVAMDRHVLRNDGRFTPQRKREYEQTFDVPGATPLTVMYGRFDVLTGRQSPHNFRIDVKKGGPTNDIAITLFLENSNYWIQQNLFGKSPDGDRKLYRYEGTVELHEVSVIR